MANEPVYLTSDLRALAGISKTTMDFYLRKEIITPIGRSESGLLFFGPAERDRLLRIVELRRQGCSLKTAVAHLASERTP